MTASSNGRDGAPLVECRDLWFLYASEPVIEAVNLQVQEGEFVAILGPNGSGKTTLIRLILGLERPSRGTVRLFGERPERFRRWDLVGYVPQAVDGMRGDFPASVEEVVAQGLYRGFSPLAIWHQSGREAIGRAMETVGMSDLRRERLSILSRGQQQRALIGRALVRNPRLLVLDEPEAGIDAAGQSQLYGLLSRLSEEGGITVIMVSHDIGAVMREATTVACINRTMIFHGPPHSVTQKELSALYGFPMDVLLHDALHEHR